MEQEEYIARMMFRADQREQLRYAKDEGRKELFALWESGVSLAEAKRRFGYSVDEAEKNCCDHRGGLQHK